MSGEVFWTFLVGLALLLLGAELLVRGASRLAEALGISPLVIGLTVVAWGTGSPELAVGTKAALGGSPDLAIGNVVGSNIANILLILGISALLAPLRVSQRLVRLDVPIMIGVSALALVMALDGRLGWFDGSLLVTLLVAYSLWTIRESRRTRRAVREEYAREFGSDAAAEAAIGWRRFAQYAVMVSGGLFLLVRGSDWLVEGASALAAAFGLSQLIIGLTIVAIGTSLPELATSAVAAARGERDIAVGNAVGSNIFNVLAVLGVTSLVASDGIIVAPAAVSLDLPIMIAVAAACLPIFFDGYRIHRWNGLMFLALYFGYIAYLVLEGTEHAALAGFTSIMVVFVLPLVVFTIGAAAIQSLRGRRGTVDRPPG